MAFVIPTATHKNQKYNSLPGPGQYTITNTLTHQHSPAPFNSTASRKPKNIKSQKQVIPPGPGAYDTTTFQQKKAVESSFKSRSTRFEHARCETQPGPGSYDPFPAVKPKKQPIEQKDNRVINMIINQNQSRKCESIKQPSHYIRVVFQNPNNKGAYISQYVDTDFIVNKEIGPGEYDTLVERKKHGSDWSKSRVSRFDQSRDSIAPGPGSYTIQKQNLKEKSSSAVFKSQDARSHFDRAKYHSSHQPYIDLMSKLDIKDDTPGPGQYYIPPSLKEKKSLVQAFGSQSERFKQPLTQTTAGPGSYNFDVKVDKPDTLISRLAKRRRCQSEVYNRQEQARPHTYDSSNNTLHDNLYKRFKNGYYGYFGAKQQRFKGANSIAPGPGKYNVGRKNKQMSTTSYMANSKRMDAKPQETPFLSYNVNIYDISKNLQKKQDFLKNLQLVDVKRPGFQSSANRFQQHKGTSCVMEQTIHQYQGENMKQKMKKLSAAFSSKTKRCFQPWDNSTPPPGYYHRELRLQKVSFNMKYGFIEKSQKDRQR